MNVKIIKCLKDNYSYIIIDEKLNTACVIDPSEPQPIINYIDKSSLRLIQAPIEMVSSDSIRWENSRR
mgnify:CR=1 FL=1